MAIGILTGLIQAARGQFRTQIEGIKVDATVEISHAYAAEPSMVPVENADVVTDTVIVRPVVISMTGRIGPAPIIGTGTISSVAAAFTRNRVRDHYNKFVGFLEKKKPITIVDKLKVFPNMIMTAFNADFSTGTGDSLPFTATFQQVLFADVQTVTLTPAEQKAVQESTRKGVKQAGESKMKESNKTFIREGIDAIRGSSSGPLSPGAAARGTVVILKNLAGIGD